jgi:streptogramin lyase
VAVAEPAPPGAPAADHGSAAPRRGSRTRSLVLAGGLVAAVVVAAVALLLPQRGGSGDAPPPRARAVQQIAVGAAPVDLAFGTGGIWVANSGDDTVTRIAPRSGKVRQKDIPAVETPFGVAVDEGRTWVVGPSGELAEIRPLTGQRLRTTNLNRQADGIAAGFGAIWIFNNTAGTVTRVDVSAPEQLGRPRAVRVGSGPSDVAVGLDRVWVTNSVSSTLVELDPVTGRVAATIPVEGGVDGLAVGEGAIWVTSPRQGRLLRVDPTTKQITPIRIGPAGREADAAVGNGAVFYISQEDGRATRVDPASNRRVGVPVRVATSPRGAVVAGSALWVADVDRGTVARLPF